jgi:hypothetical protein
MLQYYTRKQHISGLSQTSSIAHSVYWSAVKWNSPRALFPEFVFSVSIIDMGVVVEIEITNSSVGILDWIKGKRG